jgi:hypothetical protein
MNAVRSTGEPRQPAHNLLGLKAREAAQALTPKGTQFVVWARAAYLSCGSIALMSESAVLRHNLPTGFVRFLTAAEAWESGLPVVNALVDPSC